MESNNYFIQMQDFIDNFVEAKGTEYNAWFEGIKDTVKATSLYREYQAVYRNSVAGEQVITIPTSINYVHNGLDTLNVCINGMRLIKDTQYTINSDGLSITLTNPLEVALQDVEFINKKSIDGTGAESLIVQVEALNEKVDSVVNTQYVATGANDNINLSNIVKNFLDGTGNYSGVADNASLKIDVIGSLAIGDLIDGQMVFDLHNSVSSNRRVMIDFGNATIPEYVSANNINIFAVFASEENVIIENANIKVGNLNATTIYGFHGGIATNCKINIDNQNATTIYGIYAAKKSMFNDINLNKGISILATTGQLLIGNIVNQNTSISGATEVATIRI